MKTKKIASLLLAGLLALSVAACGQQPVTNNDQGSSSEVSTSESQSSTSSDAEAGQTGEKPTEPTGQLVIGGEKAAVEKAAALAKEKGARRCLPLKVSGPFHTSLLAPAGDALREKGYPIHSLAVIEEATPDHITFREDDPV